MAIINLNSTIATRDFGKKAKEVVWGLSVFKGDLIDVRTVDGVSDDYKCQVILTNFFTQKAYTLDFVFIGKVFEFYDEETEQFHTCYVSSENRANAMIQKIKEKGQVNLDNWVEFC